MTCRPRALPACRSSRFRTAMEDAKSYGRREAPRIWSTRCAALRCVELEPVAFRVDPQAQLAVMRARRLHRRALLDQGRCKRMLAVAQRRLDQREIEEVALRMASAEAMRDRRERAQQRHALRVIGFAERL